MADRPIIFSAPMVRALLGGRKTQTRRLASSPLAKVEPGDRLWVREAWSTDRQVDSIAPSDLSHGEPIAYDADGLVRTSGCSMIKAGRNRPSIHMPRWASRVTLEVTGVKVEPLQAIIDADAVAEGMHNFAGTGMWGFDPKGTPGPCVGDDAVTAFALLWQMLHGVKSWNANPEVVAITFTVHKQNIDQLELTNGGDGG